MLSRTAKSAFSASKTLIWRFWKGDLNQGPLGFESGTGQLKGLAAFQNGQIGFSASKTLIWRLWKGGFELGTFGFRVGDWAAGGSGGLPKRSNRLFRPMIS